MMRLVAMATVLLGVAAPVSASEPPFKPLVTDLKNPHSLALGNDGKVYVSLRGTPEKDGTGAVLAVIKDKAVPFAADLDDPTGLVAFREWLFVADKQRIWRIDSKGKAEVFVARDAFPTPPNALGALTVDVENGALYVCDTGAAGVGAAIYRVMPSPGPKGKMPKVTVTLLADQKRLPELAQPAALAMDGGSHLLLTDSQTGNLYRLTLADMSIEKIAGGLGSADGLAWDQYGRLFIADAKSGSLFVIPRPGREPVRVTKGFERPAGMTRDATNKFILVADAKAGTITPVPAQVPGAEVDESPLDLGFAEVFPNLQWTDWKKENDKGIPVPLRPIVLTHAGDGSNRVFVAIQQGTLHVFPNDPKADKTQVFLDIQERVTYVDNQNEEGLLGVAFHPQYKKNGEFFVFYTIKTPKNKHINVVSRFRVSKDDPNRADPASEEEILRIEHKYWNHDGGTICFGPDGYLYIAIGDGGLGNDPDNNGQNLNTLLAKVLRIDVDHPEGDNKYGIPKDNPFVDRKDARPETWAYGLRNIWRMAFDRKTGTLWAGDVGQNLFEEIDIIVKGGNYGWKLREGLHPFSPKGTGPRKDLIDPIWEYHHSLGLCIIGGTVYRGKAVPELDGAYLYGDYISGKIWALRYDDQAKRVVANRPLRTPGLPILSFGEDEQGEVYCMTHTMSGRGIFQVQRPAGKK